MQQLSDPVRISLLKNMAKSPAHFRAAVLEPREISPAMRFGRIVHAIAFRQPYQVWQGRRAGKEWDAFEAEHDGQLIVTADEYHRAMRCMDSIGETPHATRLLAGVWETEVRFTALGRACMGHLDVHGQGFVTELKTASCTEPELFQRGALRLHYHAQLAWYLDAIGHPDWPAHIVAVETAAPFAVTVFTLTPRTIEAGRKQYRLWLEQLRVCEASNAWPSYCQSVVPFDVPDIDAPPLIIDGEEVAA